MYVIWHSGGVGVLLWHGIGGDVIVIWIDVGGLFWHGATVDAMAMIFGRLGWVVVF